MNTAGLNGQRVPTADVEKSRALLFGASLAVLATVAVDRVMV